MLMVVAHLLQAFAYLVLTITVRFDWTILACVWLAVSLVLRMLLGATEVLPQPGAGDLRVARRPGGVWTRALDAVREWVAGAVARRGTAFAVVGGGAAQRIWCVTAKPATALGVAVALNGAASGGGGAQSLRRQAQAFVAGPAPKQEERGQRSGLRRMIALGGSGVFFVLMGVMMYLAGSFASCLAVAAAAFSLCVAVGKDSSGLGPVVVEVPGEAERGEVHRVAERPWVWGGDGWYVAPEQPEPVSRDWQQGGWCRYEVLVYPQRSAAVGTDE